MFLTCLLSRAKNPQRLGDWSCLHLLVERGEVEPYPLGVLEVVSIIDPVYSLS